MGKKIQLQIADPCHENWDSMTQAEKGRFCGSCQKQVIDFTNMSDSQLAAFFKKPMGSSVCGRFYEDQLDRTIEIPKKRIPWVKYFFQFALPAFLLSMKATAQGNLKMGKPLIAVPVKRTTEKERNIDTLPSANLLIVPVTKVPRIEKDSLPNIMLPRLTDLTSCSRPLMGKYIVMGNLSPTYFIPNKKNAIKGTVINSRGKKIPYAEIRLEKEPYRIYSDKKGKFYLPSWVKDSNSVMLHVSRTDYKEKEVIIYKNDQDNLVIHLEPIGDKKIEAPSEIHGEKKSAPLIEQELLDHSSSAFRLSPNPVQRNSTVYAEFDNDQDEVMQLSVFSLTGSLVLAQSEKIIKGLNRLSITVDAKWGAGIYNIQLRNEKGTLIRREKLIVQ